MKEKDPGLLSCWPDGYSRYYSVSNILKIVFGTQRPVNILDVGGDSQWMTRFLDDAGLAYKLNIIDTRKPDFKNTNPKVTYTKGDFFKIALDDFKAEVVINTDVLEHIPEDLKIPFVNRCIDFATSVAVLSAPQDDASVTFAEKNVDDNYVTHAGKHQRWLKEHFEFGKPNSKAIEAAIKKRGLSYLVIDTNNLDNWFTSFTLNFINSEIFGLLGMDEFNRSYNANIHSNGDFEGLPYRRIFIIFKDEALYKKKQAELRSFFAPQKSNKLELNSQAFTLLIENFIRANKIVAKAAKQQRVLEKNLHQTTQALLQAEHDLRNIRNSRAYKYALRVKKIVRRP